MATSPKIKRGACRMVQRGKRQVVVWLDPTQHYAVKACAEFRGVTMARYARELVLAAVAADEVLMAAGVKRRPRKGRSGESGN